MMVKWVYELPDHVKDELKNDAMAILQNIGMDHDEIMDTIDVVMREKLANVIGDEEGMLPAAKYGKYLF